MFEIIIEDTFDSAHCLRGYDGPCENVHGHTYKVQVSFKFRELESSGMAIDFKNAKSVLKLIIDKLDHKMINELESFINTNPTAENIAKYIYCEIKQELAMVSSVNVWETATSCARYYEE